MSTLMAVLWNGLAQLEYDRSRPLPPAQALYLDKMDEKMARGLDVDGQLLTSPDLGQRAQFVAGILAHAIKTNDEANVAAMCSYLAVRLPDLKQVKIIEQGDELQIDLVFDEEYVKQAPLKFTRKEDLINS